LNLLSGSGSIDVNRRAEGVRKQSEVGRLTGASHIHEPAGAIVRCLCQKFCVFRQNQFIELFSLIAGGLELGLA
jgi:hypothetical protein